MKNYVFFKNIIKIDTFALHKHSKLILKLLNYAKYGVLFNKLNMCDL